MEEFRTQTVDNEKFLIPSVGASSWMSAFRLGLGLKAPVRSVLSTSGSLPSRCVRGPLFINSEQTMLIHSWMSPKCRLAPSSKSGMGIFASFLIEPREIVAVWGGKVYTQAEVHQLSLQIPEYNSHTVSVAPGFYIGSMSPGTELDDTDLFNHSCQPNLGVVGQITLIARQQIEAGEELTFDYDTTETAAVPFHCRCGAPECRGVIDGSSWTKPDFQKAHAGYLSWNVLEAIRRSGDEPRQP
jgi:hypothetical protein